MKLKHPFLIGMAGLISLSSLSFSQVMADEFKITSSSQNNKVRFFMLQHAHEKNEQGKTLSIVKGKLKRRVKNSTIKPGYIRYQLLDGSGNLLLEGRSDYSPSLSLRDWKSGSRFQIALPFESKVNTHLKLHWQAL